jgi:hypothetical protein
MYRNGQGMIERKRANGQIPRATELYSVAQKPLMQLTKVYQILVCVLREHRSGDSKSVVLTITLLVQPLALAKVDENLWDLDRDKNEPSQLRCQLRFEELILRKFFSHREMICTVQDLNLQPSD